MTKLGISHDLNGIPFHDRDVFFLDFRHPANLGAFRRHRQTFVAFNFQCPRTSQDVPRWTGLGVSGDGWMDGESPTSRGEMAGMKWGG